MKTFLSKYFKLLWNCFFGIKLYNGFGFSADWTSGKKSKENCQCCINLSHLPHTMKKQVLLSYSFSWYIFQIPHSLGLRKKCLFWFDQSFSHRFFSNNPKNAIFLKLTLKQKKLEDKNRKWKKMKKDGTRWKKLDQNGRRWRGSKMDHFASFSNSRNNILSGFLCLFWHVQTKKCIHFLCW